MSWIKSLWDKVVNRTSVSPTLVLVEEAPQDPRGPGALFGSMCRAVGVKNRDLSETNAIALFEEGYDGPATEEEIRKVLWQFKEAHPGVAPKNSHTEQIVAGGS